MALPKITERNAEYWDKRFKALEHNQHVHAGSFTLEVEKVYKKTMRDVEKEIESWYARLARNNDINLASARKFLDTSELADFKMTLEEYIKKGRENALNQTWMKELENASARVHIGRLEALKIQIRQHFEMQYKIENQLFFDFIDEQYQLQYYHTAFEIQKGVGFGVALQAVDNVKLEKLLTKPWTIDHRTFSDRIWLKKEEFIGKLYQELTNSIARGKGPEETVRVLHKQLDSHNSRYEIRRVVMTESAYFSSEATKTVLNDLDVVKYQVLATLDNDTSEICRTMDGDVFDMKDYVVGATAPPFHPFCRTVTIPYIDDAQGLRFARDAEGNAIYVPANMKYDDWHKKFIKK